MNTYFSIQNITSVQSIKKDSKIHVIGICGVAMAPLAVALSKMGFEVSGSDREYYEPMATVLKSHQIKLIEGFNKDNITKDLALVVIGNVATKDHPEVLAVKEYAIPYTIFTQSLYDILIRNRHSIVVTGTHGKTTTTALGAATLVKLGVDPSYFIGGQVKELSESFHIGGETISIVEGDEYDSAFFAKIPKFSFYKPNTLIITSIEYDHADIYLDLVAVEQEFTKLVNSLSDKDVCICCLDNENIRRLLPNWKNRKNPPKFITYGICSDVEYKVSSKELVTSGFQEVEIKCSDKKLFSTQNVSYKFPLSGSYNALNSTAIMIALRLLDFETEKIINAFGTFAGVKRRQEIIFNQNEITLIEDFAHHPTAVKETLKGIKSRFPNSRIVAIFEPRSNTSRRPVFREPYSHAFELADRIIFGDVKRREVDKDLEVLEVRDLAGDLKKLGKNADVFANPDEIAEVVSKEVKKGDLVIVMSNGSFGGLVEKIRASMERRAQLGMLSNHKN